MVFPQLGVRRHQPALRFPLTGSWSPPLLQLRSLLDSNFRKNASDVPPPLPYLAPSACLFLAPRACTRQPHEVGLLVDAAPAATWSPRPGAPPMLQEGPLSHQPRKSSDVSGRRQLDPGGDEPAAAVPPSLDLGKPSRARGPTTTEPRPQSASTPGAAAATSVQFSAATKLRPAPLAPLPTRTPASRLKPSGRRRPQGQRAPVQAVQARPVAHASVGPEPAYSRARAGSPAPEAAGEWADSRAKCAFIHDGARSGRFHGRSASPVSAVSPLSARRSPSPSFPSLLNSGCGAALVRPPLMHAPSCNFLVSSVPFQQGTFPRGKTSLLLRLRVKDPFPGEGRRQRSSRPGSHAACFFHLSPPSVRVSQP